MAIKGINKVKSNFIHNIFRKIDQIWGNSRSIMKNETFGRIKSVLYLIYNFFLCYLPKCKSNFYLIYVTTNTTTTGMSSFYYIQCYSYFHFWFQVWWNSIKKSRIAFQHFHILLTVIYSSIFTIFCVALLLMFNSIIIHNSFLKNIITMITIVI
jgi:hypothetical protein